MKKRIISIIVILFLMAGLTGCGGQAGGGDGKISIVCTTFPQYDWLMQILGEKSDTVQVSMLLSNGVDLHSYQPTADDMILISDCELFIYVGGESDKWVPDVLKSTGNTDMRVINLLEILGSAAKIEEDVPGLAGIHEDEEEHEREEYDEHVWLSLKNAQLFCGALRDALCALDGENKALYEENCAAYIKELAALDREYRAAVDTAARDTLLFCDRFPFRYLTDDYGLKYYAAFTGCSAETEASVDTVTLLAEKTDELSLSAVLIIDGSEQSIADTVIRSSRDKNQTVLSMNSMQSVTLNDIGSGTSYLSIMRENLAVLKQALN